MTDAPEMPDAEAVRIVCDLARTLPGWESADDQPSTSGGVIP